MARPSAPPRGLTQRVRQCLVACATALLVACATAARPAPGSEEGVSRAATTTRVGALPHASEPTAPPTPAPNGLPGELGPLSRGDVVGLAFANDAATRMGKVVYAAGAVEDSQGVTVCVVFGAPSVIGTSMIPHPLPFAASPSRTCAREPLAQLDVTGDPTVENTPWGIAFVVALRRGDESLRRAYVFADELRVYEAHVTSTRRTGARERVGRPPPWPRSAELTRKAESRARIKKPLAMRDAALVTRIERIEAPAWVTLLERNSELSTRTLIAADDPVLALTLARESSADGEPTRELLMVRGADRRWTVSSVSNDVAIEAASAPTLGEGVLLVLARAPVQGAVSRNGAAYAESVKLRVWAREEKQLVVRGEISVGEIGTRRVGPKNLLWRVFHQARVVGPQCLEVVRDHAWTAWQDRRTRSISDARRMTRGVEGLPEHLPSAYAKTTGRYTWTEGALVSRRCARAAAPAVTAKH